MQGFVIQLSRQYSQELAVRCKSLAEAEAIASRLAEGASPDDLGIQLMPVDNQISSSFNVRQIFNTDEADDANSDQPTEL